MSTNPHEGWAKLALTTLALCFAPVWLAGQEPKPPAPAQRLEQLERTFEQQQDECFRKYDGLKDEVERAKILAQLKQLANRAVLEARAIAESAAGTEIAAESWAFVLKQAPDTDSPSIAIRAFDILLEQHLASPVWKQLGYRLDYMVTLGVGDEKFERSMHTLMEKSPHRVVQAGAMFALGTFLADKDDPAKRAAGLSLMQRILKEFAGVAEANRCVERALTACFQLEHMQPGMPCPDFEASDATGARFKLSDYQGKVVLIDFWGYWCHGCVAMLPHEKTLVKRLSNEPFALIGMNTDSDKPEVLAKRFKDDGLDWRQALLGPPGQAEITRQWIVHGYPTLYLVDAKGVIRKYWVGSPGDEMLDGEVDKLVAEAKSKK